MNSLQAKQLSLPDIMSRLGYEPVKTVKGRQELWYKSPFRQEEEPSFHTSYLGGKWIWNDFGDIGGTVIDFVMRHEGYTSVKEALEFLEGMFQGHFFARQSHRTGEGQGEEPGLFSFQQQTADAAPQGETVKELEFIAAHAISNPVIHQYLERGRGIPQALADRYLKEIEYRNRRSGKTYFAFGMQNESGGYEIRAATDRYPFKSALIVRDITLIPGSSGGRSVNVVEGMVDFLSLCAMYNTLQLTNDTIILHSLSSFDRAVEKIRQQSYTVINLFLDNDTPGRNGTQEFINLFGSQAQDQSELYRNYRDVNEALVDNVSKL